DLLSDSDRRTAAKSILSQAEHLERLVVNLLEVARLERGKNELRTGSIVDAAAVAERVAAEYRLAHPDRVLIFSSEGDCRARGDELFIGQIVSNLVSNAIKYAPRDEPIEVRVAEND